ncbi:GGDEF and EAL domain-containing protein [Roseomonas sp. HF4]|uniref:GGDEF and EAL domain-containing protein n=1 Tax=Roseomonas sp. HF4 TaxID=2562313 RepID=UPI001485BA88|nr:GGDEF and EAL domain-containing protein [Roseomonas sp. HF4]
MQASPVPTDAAPEAVLGVLVVDDEPMVRDQIALALRRRGHAVSIAGSVAEATAVMALQDDIGVVVTDIRMPEEDGLSLARRVAGAPEPLRPEVVLVTGHATIEDAASAVRIGVSDFLRKPLRAAELAEAVGAAMKRARARRAAGTPSPAETPDPLTGLAGRAELVGRLLAPRADACGLVLVDLDRFRLVNEALGMAAGDALLADTGRRLRAAAPPGALVARFGDDEFAVLVEPAEEAALGALAERLRAALTRGFEAGGTRLALTASLGHAVSAEGDGAACLHGAEAALRTARGRGGDRSVGLAEAKADGGLRRARLAAGLAAALEGGPGLALAFQPIRRAADLALQGFEALVRFEDPVLGTSEPDEFLPVAAEYGMMDALGRRVLHDAVSAAAAWRRDGLPAGRIAVNVAPDQLRRPGFVGELRAMADAAALPAETLVVEVTEAGALPGGGLAALAALREAGFGVAIDDFGAGHSSLARLRDLPASSLKFDRAFTERLPGAEADRALLAGLVRLADALGLATVAEGVETPAQLAALREAGVQACQGWLLGRPMPARDVPGFLAGAAGPLRLDGIA